MDFQQPDTSTSTQDAAAYPEQQQREIRAPGGIKGFFSNFAYGMGQALRKDAGLPTDYDLANQQLQRQQVQIQQQRANTDEGYRQAAGEFNRQKAAQIEPRAVSQEEADTLNKQFGANTYTPRTMMHPAAIDALLKQGAVNIGKQNVAGTQAGAKVQVAQIGADQRDRATSLMAEVRRDVAQGNVALAKARINLMSTLGFARLQQGQDRIDFQQNGPTGQMRTMGQTAGDLRQLIPDFRTQIASLDKAGKLGPINGRWEDFLASKVGNADPDYERFRVAADLLDTGLMKAHFGGRGAVQAMEHFKTLFNSGKASAPQLGAALDAIDNQLAIYQRGGQYTKPGASSPSSAIPTYDINGRRINP